MREGIGFKPLIEGKENMKKNRKRRRKKKEEEGKARVSSVPRCSTTRFEIVAQDYLFVALVRTIRLSITPLEEK